MCFFEIFFRRLTNPVYGFIATARARQALFEGEAVAVDAADPLTKDDDNNKENNAPSSPTTPPDDKSNGNDDDDDDKNDDKKKCSR